MSSPIQINPIESLHSVICGSCEVLNSPPQGSGEWVEGRSFYIGGSEVASIMGENSYDNATALAIWGEKTGLNKTIRQVTEAMLRGIAMEGYLREATARKLGDDYLVIPPPEGELYRNIETPIMVANVDGFVYHPKSGWGILECKTTNWRLAELWNGDAVPTEYYYQIQHYMAVTGLSWAYIICDTGNDLVGYVVPANPDHQEKIRESCVRFWSLVESRTPPELVWSDRNRMPIDPDSDQDYTEPTEEVMEILVRLSEATDIRKGAVKKEESLKGDLINHLISGPLRGNGVCVELKQQKRTSIDTKRLKEEHPEIASDLMRETEFSKLLVKWGDKYA